MSRSRAPVQATDRKNYSAACSVQRFRSTRLGDSFYFAISKIVESLLRRGARDFSLHFATQTLQKPRRGGRPRGFHLDCALAQRLKSLLRRAGDRCRSARENWSLLSNMPELASGRPGRPYAGQARPKGVLLACRERKSVSVRAPGGSWVCSATSYDCPARAAA